MVQARVVFRAAPRHHQVGEDGELAGQRSGRAARVGDHYVLGAGGQGRHYRRELRGAHGGGVGRGPAYSYGRAGSEIGAGEGDRVAAQVMAGGRADGRNFGGRLPQGGVGGIAYHHFAGGSIAGRHAGVTRGAPERVQRVSGRPAAAAGQRGRGNIRGVEIRRAAAAAGHGVRFAVAAGRAAPVTAAAAAAVAIDPDHAALQGPLAAGRGGAVAAGVGAGSRLGAGIAGVAGFTVVIGEASLPYGAAAGAAGIAGARAAAAAAAAAAGHNARVGLGDGSKEQAGEAAAGAGIGVARAVIGSRAAVAYRPEETYAVTVDPAAAAGDNRVDGAVVHRHQAIGRAARAAHGSVSPAAHGAAGAAAAPRVHLHGAAGVHGESVFNAGGVGEGVDMVAARVGLHAAYGRNGGCKAFGQRAGLAAGVGDHHVLGAHRSLDRHHYADMLAVHGGGHRPDAAYGHMGRLGEIGTGKGDDGPGPSGNGADAVQHGSGRPQGTVGRVADYHHARAAVAAGAVAAAAAAAGVGGAGIARAAAAAAAQAAHTPIGKTVTGAAAAAGVPGQRAADIELQAVAAETRSGGAGGPVDGPVAAGVTGAAAAAAAAVIVGAAGVVGAVAAGVALAGRGRAAAEGEVAGGAAAGTAGQPGQGGPAAAAAAAQRRNAGEDGVGAVAARGRPARAAAAYGYSIDLVGDGGIGIVHQAAGAAAAAHVAAAAAAAGHHQGLHVAAGDHPESFGGVELVDMVAAGIRLDAAYGVDRGGESAGQRDGLAVGVDDHYVQDAAGGQRGHHGADMLGVHGGGLRRYAADGHLGRGGEIGAGEGNDVAAFAGTHIRADAVQGGRRGPQFGVGGIAHYHDAGTAVAALVGALVMGAAAAAAAGIHAGVAAGRRRSVGMAVAAGLAHHQAAGTRGAAYAFIPGAAAAAAHTAVARHALVVIVAAAAAGPVIVGAHYRIKETRAAVRRQSPAVKAVAVGAAAAAARVAAGAVVVAAAVLLPGRAQPAEHHPAGRISRSAAAGSARAAETVVGRIVLVGAGAVAAARGGQAEERRTAAGRSGKSVLVRAWRVHAGGGAAVAINAYCGRQGAGGERNSGGDNRAAAAAAAHVHAAAAAAAHHQGFSQAGRGDLEGVAAVESVHVVFARVGLRAAGSVDRGGKGPGQRGGLAAGQDARVGDHNIFGPYGGQERHDGGDLGAVNGSGLRRHAADSHLGADGEIGTGQGNRRAAPAEDRAHARNGGRRGPQRSVYGVFNYDDAGTAVADGAAGAAPAAAAAAAGIGRAGLGVKSGRALAIIAAAAAAAQPAGRRYRVKTIVAGGMAAAAAGIIHRGAGNSVLQADTARAAPEITEIPARAAGAAAAAVAVMAARGNAAAQTAVITLPRGAQTARLRYVHGIAAAAAAGAAGLSGIAGIMSAAAAAHRGDGVQDGIGAVSTGGVGRGTARAAAAYGQSVIAFAERNVGIVHQAAGAAAAAPAAAAAAAGHYQHFHVAAGKHVKSVGAGGGELVDAVTGGADLVYGAAGGCGHINVAAGLLAVAEVGQVHHGNCSGAAGHAAGRGGPYLRGRIPDNAGGRDAAYKHAHIIGREIGAGDGDLGAAGAGAEERADGRDGGHRELVYYRVAHHHHAGTAGAGHAHAEVAVAGAAAAAGIGSAAHAGGAAGAAAAVTAGAGRPETPGTAAAAGIIGKGTRNGAEHAQAAGAAPGIAGPAPGHGAPAAAAADKETYARRVRNAAPAAVALTSRAGAYGQRAAGRTV